MVYVDDLLKWPKTKEWPYDRACHMFADTPAELHAMATFIGLRRAWFQPNGTLPHYDLTALKRELALIQGAKALTRKETAAFIKMNRVKRLTPKGR